MFSGPFPGIAPAIESGTIREIFLSKTSLQLLLSNSINHERIVIGLVSNIVLESLFLMGATTFAKSVFIPFVFSHDICIPEGGQHGQHCLGNAF